MPLAPQLDGPRVQILNGRVFIEMNWDEADSLRDHFLRQGLPGTVVLDPAAHEARLEFWDNPAPEQVRAVLREWLS
jgi:hypothetical protein